MKNFKRFTAAIAATLMAAALSVPMMASLPAGAAEGDFTITINDTTSGHTYEAYQIFAGTLSEDKMSLGNITWGSGVDTTRETDLIDTIKKITLDTGILVEKDKSATKMPFSGATSAADVAAVLSKGYYASSTAETTTPFDNNAEITEKFAKVIGDYLSTTCVTAEAYDDDGETTNNIDGYKATIASTAPGYYLVKDKNGSLASAWNAYTNYILTVVKDVTVEPKGDYPTVEKKIKENTKSVDPVESFGQVVGNENPTYTTPSGFNEVADYSVGISIPFRLIGTMPANIDDYAGYYYQFTDTMSKGFSEPSDYSVDIYTYDDEGVHTYRLADSSFVIADGTAPTEGDYAGGKVFTVTINNLKADLTYYTEGSSGWSTTATTGKLNIEDDTVVVVSYTAMLDNDAVIGLEGNPNKVDLTYSNNPNAEGDGYLTDKGKTPEETVIAFTYELDVTKYKDSIDEINKITDTSAGFKLYNSDKSKVAIVDTVNYKIIGWTELTSSMTDEQKDAAGTEVYPNTEGTFKFIGLDSNTYILEETKTPDGYNTMEDLKLVVKAETVNTQGYKESDAYGTPAEVLKSLKLYKTSVADSNLLNTADTADNGKVAHNIINQRGSELPSTGGIGTTLFYVGGGCMVALAGIFLISKKRMSRKED